MSDQVPGALERPEDAGPAPEGTVARWLMELKLADKEERPWRETAREALKRYKGRDGKDGKPSSGMNILYANTESLAPALFNSSPRPDVRRRYRDDDPVGKMVSECLQRALSFSNDEEDLDEKVEDAILHLCLTGRGVVRVRYVPSITQVGGEHQEAEERPDQEAQEGPEEELVWEQALTEVVSWDDFRHGPGKAWQEVRWIAFKHRLTREECIDKFGSNIGGDVPLEDVDLGEKVPDSLNKDVFKRASCWEIWDRDEKRVIWISQTYPDRPLLEQDDPLRLVNFFPCPRPIYSQPSADDLIPTTLYSQYRSQADELDKITMRYQKILGAIKARGVYDSTIGELSNLFSGDDNELLPAQNAIALAERGGLDKFIWFAPIQELVVVARELVQQREVLKQTVYEISGLSDIMRGATNAQETATAQQIKSQWGTMRLQRMQRRVQRFIRDIMRIKAELIAERFQPQTLQSMTGLKLPTMQQKQAAQQQYQQAAMMAQQQGQQPPPPPQLPPAWEELFQVMRDDALRSFRIDIETDSTIQQQLAEDQQAFASGIEAVTKFMQAVMPLVSAGAFPIEGAKAICLAWARRTRMGMEAEDAIEQMKAPPPPQQPQDNSLQVQQLKNQDAEAERQHTERVKAAEIQAQQAIEAAKLEQEKWKAKLEAMAAITAEKLRHEHESERAMALEQTRGQQSAQSQLTDIAAQQDAQQLDLMASAAAHQQDLEHAAEQADFDRAAAQEAPDGD